MSSPSRPVSIRDLSAASGLSISTISLALRNNPRISQETRDRVFEVAKSMGYRANPMMAAHWEKVRARKAASFQSVVAVLNDWDNIPELSKHTWIGPIFASLRDRADQLGYFTEEFATGERNPKLRRAKLASVLRVLKARGIYAIVNLLSISPSVFLECLDLFEEFTVVSIGSEYKTSGNLLLNSRRLPFHRTNPDHYGNMLLLLDELKARGYKRPGFWANPWAESRIGCEHVAAFNLWIQSLPESDQCPVNWTQWKLESDFEATHPRFNEWLHATQPDVVLCENAPIREWIQSCGLKIPDDIGLVHPELGPTEPGWSGIDCRLGSIASAGIDLLTAHLHRNERGVPEVPKNVRLAGQWVEGSTTRSLPGASRDG